MGLTNHFRNDRFINKNSVDVQYNIFIKIFSCYQRIACTLTKNSIKAENSTNFSRFLILGAKEKRVECHNSLRLTKLAQYQKEFI